MQLLTAHHDRFRAFVLRRLGSADAADEVLQTAYLKGMEHLGEVRDDGHTTAWFYRILRNAIIDHLRARSRSEARDVSHDDEQGLSADDDGALEALVCACWAEQLIELKPDYRALIETVDLREQRLIDVAQAAGERTNTVAVRLHRARRALAQKLVESCGICSAHGCLACDCRPKV
jgi:RNA polymerase sigma-70 factor (ECF subfamily)